jgi:hypothetical protein
MLAEVSAADATQLTEETRKISVAGTSAHQNGHHFLKCVVSWQALF